jgi:hypothetical protein
MFFGDLDSGLSAGSFTGITHRPEPAPSSVCEIHWQSLSPPPVMPDPPYPPVLTRAHRAHRQEPTHDVRIARVRIEAKRASPRSAHYSVELLQPGRHRGSARS